MGRPRMTARERLQRPRDPHVDPNAIYSARGAAHALRIALANLRAHLRAGEIRHVLNGRRFQIRGQWLLDWLEARAKS